MKDIWLRLRALLFRTRTERDLNDELEFHIAMQVRKNLANGMSESEARCLARIELGASDAFVKEQCRDQRRINFFETLFQDIRYALRGFRRTPLFAITVIATIALGLGINTAVFTIFNGYVLRPMSVRDPYSLYSFHWLNQQRFFAAATLADLETLRRQPGPFTDTFATHDLQLRVDGRMTYGELVTGDFFRKLGAGPVLGRVLVPEDSSAPGREPVMVLSFNCWKSRYAGDPDILGRKIYVHGYPLEVVGVVRDGFTGMNDMPFDFWAPISMSPQLDSDDANWVTIFGWLKHDVSPAQGEAMLAALGRQITADRPEAGRASAALLRSHATIVPLSKEALLVMTPVLGAFFLVLLIACANVANMMLARAMARQREIGIRLSLGAERARLIRQLLTESILLSVPAAALGLAISQAIVQLGVRAMLAALPAEFSEYLRVISLPPDLRVFAFMMIVALIAAVLFGLAPALQATRASVVQAARGDFSSDHRPSKLRNGLVVVQVAGCGLLLICTGILLRGANRIHSIDNGLDSSHAIELRVQDKLRARVLSTLQAEPLVETLAAASEVPLDDSFPIASGIGAYVSVSPEFFNVFRIPILRGRNFTANEALEKAPVAIVTQALADHLFPKVDAVGQSIHFEKNPSTTAASPHADVRVIGIARDIDNELTDRPADHRIVFFATNIRAAQMVLIARVNGDAARATQQLASLLDKATPGAVDEMHAMETELIARNSVFRLAYVISGTVGGLALILAVTGIYGVLSYVVIQRRKEIGVRLALGASERQVVGLVLAQSIRLGFIGLAIGATLALGVARIYASFVDKSGILNSFDWMVYFATILLVSLTCLVAGFIPSLRASRIDPATTLRYD